MFSAVSWSMLHRSSHYFFNISIRYRLIFRGPRLIFRDRLKNAENGLADAHSLMLTKPKLGVKW